MRDNIWKFYMIFFKKKIENKDKRQNWKYFKEFRNKELDFEKMIVEGWEQKRIRKWEFGFGGEEIQIQSFLEWKCFEKTKRTQKNVSKVKIYNFSSIF